MDFDMFKNFTSFEAFDATKMTEQFSKMFSGMNMPAMQNVPTVDVDAFVATQRKSVEAFNEANQKVLEGVRTVAERSNEIMRDAVEKSTTAFEALGKVKDPQEAVEKQVELARKSYDKAVKDMNELGNMVAKVNADAVAPINARIKESFAEVKSAVAIK